jgi:hypothetical protein
MPQITPDINGQLKDAGLIAASAAAEVGGSAKILDLGAGVAWTPFVVSLKVTALEIASNDELYTVKIEGSTSSTFASTIETLAETSFGANEAITGGTDVDTTTGEFLLYGHNDRDGTVYRYLRAYTVVAGTIATGINYQAWLTALAGHP